jgi:diaminopimelate epimerase
MADAKALPFHKYSGCGNDFILIHADNIDAVTLQPLVPLLCHRTEGIGADGVLLIKRDAACTGAYVHIFNADGSEAAFCGNGLRCVARHLAAVQSITEASYQLETLSGSYPSQVSNSEVTIALGDIGPITGPYHQAATPYPIYAITVGVPHAIVICPNIDTVDVEGIGRLLRHSPLFAPHGANINFICEVDTHQIMVRTYERGVEAETLACGSGAAASAIVAAYSGAKEVSGQRRVLTKHGSSLHYAFQMRGATALQVTMRGPTAYCFNGTYQLTGTLADRPSIFALPRA